MGPDIHIVVDSMKEGENFSATVFWHLGNLLSFYLWTSYYHLIQRENKKKKKSIPDLSSSQCNPRMNCRAWKWRLTWVGHVHLDELLICWIWCLGILLTDYNWNLIRQQRGCYQQLAVCNYQTKSWCLLVDCFGHKEIRVLIVTSWSFLTNIYNLI